MIVPLRLACATALTLLAAAAPAAAQSGQVALPAAPGPVASGACGQPLAATFRFAAPIDVVPAEPFVARIARNEPVYLEFAIAAGTRVALRTRDSGGDPYLVLFDTVGPVTSNDDGGGGTDSLIDQALAAGSYCAQVRLYGGGMEPEVFVTLDLATGEAAAALAAVSTGDDGGGDATLPDACSDPALTDDIGPVGAGIGALLFAGTLRDGRTSDWTFAVTEGLRLQFDARSQAFDTILDLVDAAGTVLDSNDDGPNGTDSRIAADLAPGSYCLRVTSYGGNGGAFELLVTDEPEETPYGGGDAAAFCADPRLTFDFGRPVGPGLGLATLSGWVAPGLFEDWRLSVVAATPLQIDARSVEFDTLIDLADGEGQYLDGNDDGPSGTDSRLVVELDEGEYCLRVRGYGGSGGAYEIALTDAPEDDGAEGGRDAMACSDPAWTDDLGRVVAPGFGILRIPGTLAPGARQGWWMTVEGATPLQFDASSRDFDTVLTLHDGQGRLVAENDDGDAGSDSRLTETLAPGVYCLSLRSWGGGGTGAYLVALTEQDEATLRRAAIEAGEMIPGPDSGVDIEDLGTLATTVQTQRLSQERTKWLAFTLAEGGLVQAQSSSLIGGFTLRLYDAAGTRLAEAESSGILNAASLYRELAPGRYLIAMTLAPGAGGRINLRQVVLTRFVRP